MASSTIKENAHKIIYLANAYNGKALHGLSKQFALTVLDWNTALWYAQEIGAITISEDKMKFEVHEDKLPTDWDFGPEVRNLMNKIIYAVDKCNQVEVDIAEPELNGWLEGFMPQDIFVAGKRLLETEVIALYDITTATAKGLQDETYSFYTLSENVGKEWGRKQFQDKSRLKKSKA